MFTREQVKEGMPVFSADGHRLGKVIAVGNREFQLERGHLFHQDYIAPLSDIHDVHEGRIYLSEDREQVLRGQDYHEERQGETVAGAGTVGAVGYGAGRDSARGAEVPSGRYESQRGYDLQNYREPPRSWSDREFESGSREGSRELTGRAAEEVRIPVTSEELEVVKRERPGMAAQIHKRVVTEMREFKVPVTREEVVMERIAVSPHDLPAGEATFKEERMVIPLMEEEVEIRKHPRVREEVVLHKRRLTEQRSIHEGLRHQEVDVEPPRGFEGFHPESEPRPPRH